MANELSFGAWVRRRRRHLDLTQEELAKQAGCSLVTIHKLETDERRPSKQLAERLALFLAIPADEQARFVAFARAAQPSQEGEGGQPAPQERDALPVVRAMHVDWGEAPDVVAFYGRQAEREQLRRWLVDERCRVVALLGMGGIGKTALATSVAQELQPHFDCLLWRSLRNAPPLTEIVDECLDFLTGQPTQDVMLPVERRIGLLVDALRSRRALIVLDNAEAILQAGQDAGHYRPGYENYGDLLQSLGERSHQGALLLTSREKPKEIARLEGGNAPVRSLSLKSLDVEAGRALLADKGIGGTTEKAAALSARYSGNPLALKVAAETIRELFGGDIAAFLQEETTIIGDVRELLAAQFARLSPLEQETLLWLAVNREAVTAEELRGDLVQPVSKSLFFDLLNSLRRRSLVEQGEMGFTLQNVVMEFLTEFLIEEWYEELLALTPKRFHQHALLKAQAKEYVRESQQRLLLQPLAERLLAAMGKGGLEAHMRRLLAHLRESQAGRRGYAGGNILNLLLHLQSDLSSWDFSNLALWQLYARGRKLRDINFHQSDLAKSSFTTAFSGCIALAFSPDGSHLAGGNSGGDLTLWRVQDRELLLSFRAYKQWITSIAFSVDGGTVITASSDKTILLWDLHSLLAAPFGNPQPLRTLLGHEDEVWSIAIHPQGRLLASGSLDRSVRLWDLPTGRCLAILRGHTNNIDAVCFSPTGERLASTGHDSTILLWDTATGALLSTIAVQVGHLMALCFSPDGRTIAAAGDDAIIRLWDVETGQCIQELHGHSGPLWSLAFHSDGSLLASGGVDRSVRVWRLEDGECLHTLYGHGTRVACVRFHPQGDLLASGSITQNVCLWDSRSGRCLRRFEGYVSWLWVLAFSPDGRWLVSGDYHDLHFWEPYSGATLRMLEGHTDRVTALSFHPDGHLLASGSADRSIRLWEVESGLCVGILWGDPEMIRSLSFHPDGKMLVSTSDEGALRLWDIESKQCVAILHGHTDILMQAVCVSPDGRLAASGGQDRTIRLWDLATRQCVRILDNPEGNIKCLCFSRDSRTIYSGGSDQMVREWDVQTGKRLRTLAGHTDWVLDISLGPDGMILASAGGDHLARLWDVRTGECLHTLAGHSDEVYCIKFNPDGRTVVTSSGDQTLHIWDVQSGDCLRVVHADRPYERMDISEVSGLTTGQIISLKQLGAVTGS